MFPSGSPRGPLAANPSNEKYSGRKHFISAKGGHTSATATGTPRHHGTDAQQDDVLQYELTDQVLHYRVSRQAAFDDAGRRETGTHSLNGGLPLTR